MLKRKHDDDLRTRRRSRVTYLGWLIAAIALLYIFALPIAEFLLIVSGHPNANAAVKLARALDMEPEPLPTYTQLPTYTPYPTYTPFPTSTPTFTPSPTPTPTGTPTPTPIPPGAVLAHMRAEHKAELVVAEFELSERDFHVAVDWGLCSYGGDFTAQGTVEAGIDLTDLHGDSIEYDAASETYALNLPAPQLTKCDVEYIRLIKNSFSFCNPDFDQLRRLGEIQVMSSLVDRAVERGILDDAQEQAALVLEDLVRTFTGKRVSSEFQTATGRLKMDQTCMLKNPGNWTYNKPKNVWRRLSR